MADTLSGLLEGRVSEDRATLTMHGTTYPQRPTLGEGGLGSAYLYTALDGTGDVVVRFPNSGTRSFSDAIRDEIAPHRLATGGGHKKILGLAGAARLSDDTFAIVTDVAHRMGGGDVAHGQPDLVERGALPESAADRIALTPLLGSAEGLAEPHSGGQPHLDSSRHICSSAATASASSPISASSRPSRARSGRRRRRSTNRTRSLRPRSPTGGRSSMPAAC